jgi:hypothetical protein
MNEYGGAVAALSIAIREYEGDGYGESDRVLRSYDLTETFEGRFAAAMC